MGSCCLTFSSAEDDQVTRLDILGRWYQSPEQSELAVVVFGDQREELPCGVLHLTQQ